MRRHRRQASPALRSLPAPSTVKVRARVLLACIESHMHPADAAPPRRWCQYVNFLASSGTAAQLSPCVWGLVTWVLKLPTELRSSHQLAPRKYPQVAPKECRSGARGAGARRGGGHFHRVHSRLVATYVSITDRSPGKCLIAQTHASYWGFNAMYLGLLILPLHRAG
jgi:hypothetical protein